MFKSTSEGASISNLIFEWTTSTAGAQNAINNDGHNITSVGGVSCLDNGSTFSNIDVIVGDGKRLIGDTKGGVTSADTFGGIVASGTNSNIIGCTFSGNVDLKLTSNTSAYFGGIVGSGKKIPGENKEDGTTEITSMTVVSSYVGLNDKPANFNITLADANHVYIGAIAGATSQASLASNRAGGANYKEANQFVTTSIKATGEVTNLYYGGLVGYADTTSISRNDVLPKLTFGEGSENITNAYLGGLAGVVGITAEGTDDEGNKISEIKTSNTNVDFDLTALNGTNLMVSAGIGFVSTGEVTISQSLFKGSIYSEKTIFNETTHKEETIQAQNLTSVYAGGIVGQAKSIVNINESMSYVDMILGSQNDAVYTREIKIYIGGMVGKSESSVLIN